MLYILPLVHNRKHITQKFISCLNNRWSDYGWAIRAYNKDYAVLYDKQLNLISDSSESGYHTITFKPLAEFKDKFFSIKTLANPSYLLNFNHTVIDNKIYLLLNDLKITIFAVTKCTVDIAFLSKNKFRYYL